MNLNNCDLKNNEFWDCVYCADRNKCPNVRNWTGCTITAMFMLVFFAIFLLVIINL